MTAFMFLPFNGTVKALPSLYNIVWWYLCMVRQDRFPPDKQEEMQSGMLANIHDCIPV
jgi:hypothetical protein